MSATIIYKGGILSGPVENWLLKKRLEYPYFMEISPKLSIQKFSTWADENLTKRMTTLQVNSFDRPRAMCVAQFCIVPLSRFVDSSNYLVGFVSLGDRSLAVQHFGEFVVSEEPFATHFKI